MSYLLTSVAPDLFDYHKKHGLEIPVATKSPFFIKGPRGALPKFYGLEVVWDAEKTLVK